MPVTAGQELSVVVGGVGRDGERYVGGERGRPGGGGNGGDYPGPSAGEFEGGGGGGYSAVLDLTTSTPTGPPPLVIAAGGGGGSGLGAGGGNGGLGAGGGEGHGGCNLWCGFGGGGAVGDTGGSGGAGEYESGNGSPGRHLNGGDGGKAPGRFSSSGGGGGGGYAGGGGGGGGNLAGGGGGGSSYGVGAGLSDMTHTTAPASVTITYTIPGLKLAKELLTHTSSYAPNTEPWRVAEQIHTDVYHEEFTQACAIIPTYLGHVTLLTTLTPAQADQLKDEAVRLHRELGCA